MKSVKRIVIAVLLIVIGGCTTRLSTPAAPTTVPAAIATVAPSATPTTAPTSTATATATLQPPSAQQPFSITLQVAQSEVDVNGLLYLPQDYGRDAQRQWPLIVFLHGSGERGYDSQILTSIGLPQILQDRSDVPFVVVSPQLSSDEWWNDKDEMLNALVDWVGEQYAIDPQRIYLTGFSLGGFGTWALGLTHLIGLRRSRR